MNRLVILMMLCVTGGIASTTPATTIDVQVDGTDVIFLAGRTDITIPPANQDPASFPIERHTGPTPEEALETFPTKIPLSAGNIVSVTDPAAGGINFFNGFGPPFFGPEGNTASGSNLGGLDGISGYQGTEGALAGVFLDDNVPASGPTPTTLNFSTSASRDFLTLSPGLGQVFFIGDGATSGGTLQQFIAPAGATRLFIGIPDGFSFDGPPGAYDDNDGAYQIRLNVIPEPTHAVLLGLTGLMMLGKHRPRQTA